ncbi:MAG: protein kinase domain-containing protein [Phycisphaerae bacterium]
MTDANRHRRITEIFKQAIELPSEQRDAYVKSACHDDDAMRREIEKMLAVDNQDESWLNHDQVKNAVEAGETVGLPVDRRRQANLPNIDGYEIIDILGRGGMGIVYRAVQKKLNRTVALKLLPALVGHANPDAVSRFQREATAAARLHHTNIVPIYDFGESDDGYFYAMELIAGPPLSDAIPSFHGARAMFCSQAQWHQLMRSTINTQGVAAADDPLLASRTGGSSTGRGAAYFKQVARWISEAADALHFAHAQDIIHRDIKPANLILADDGRLMIADFGLARDLGEESVTMTGSLLGTVRYLSPEQAMAKRIPIDHRTDIYSLGVTLYEMITFQPAYPGTEQAAVLADIISRDPTAPRKCVPSIPRDLETICMKAMEKSPAQRYATAGEFADDLRCFINGEPIAARRAGPLARLGKLARRRRVASVVVVAILVMLAGAAYAYRVINLQRTEFEVEALLQEAVDLQEKKNWVDAQAKFEAAIERSPDSTPALLNMCRYLIQNPDSALDEMNWVDDILETLAERGERPGSVYNMSAIRRKRLGDFEGGLRLFMTALKNVQTAQEQVYFLKNIALLKAILGDINAAHEFLLRADEIGREGDASQPFIYRDLASLGLILEEEDAASRIKEAYELKSGLSPDLALIRARITLALGADPIKAYADASFAAENQNEHGKAYRLVGLAALRLGRYDEVLSQCNKAIDASDNKCVNHLIMAVARAKQENSEETRYHLAVARSEWPAAFQTRDFLASDKGALLWFESRKEFESLRDEARKLAGL